MYLPLIPAGRLGSLARFGFFLHLPHLRKHRYLPHGSHFGTQNGRSGLPGCCWSALKGCSGPALAYLISKFLQGGLDALQFFCTCCTCENTAIYRTGATWHAKALLFTAPEPLWRSKCRSSGPLQRCQCAQNSCSGPLWCPYAPKIAVLACSGTASAL